jgi:glycosyltransferase involved in cell wall biosynthesis
MYRISSGPSRHGEIAFWWNLWRALYTLRDRFQILHAQGSTYRNSAIGPIARVLGKKSLAVVTMAHNDLNAIGRTSAGKIQALFLGRVDRYVALSREIGDEIRRLPLDSSKVVEIPRGVDLERFTPASEGEKVLLRQAYNLPFGLLAIYVGVFDSRKNVDWLVKTWAKNRTQFEAWKLVLIGPASRDHRDQHLRETLQKWVKAENLGERILFRDFSPRIEEYFRAADLFVLPSKNEGMPNVALEAMACGIPCVLSRISGACDLVSHGVTGMLFDVDDERSFVKAVHPVVSSQSLRATIGARARATVMESYSNKIIAGRYLRLYHEMLEGR